MIKCCPPITEEETLECLTFSTVIANTTTHLLSPASLYCGDALKLSVGFKRAAVIVRNQQCKRRERRARVVPLPCLDFAKPAAATRASPKILISAVLSCGWITQPCGDGRLYPVVHPSLANKLH
ncbi:hypothetical protein J6590_005220 [Homalodisca vitripennis]|nr:hypothetical protein J6590_005220 [Homalodisca vitripennis]